LNGEDNKSLSPFEIDHVGKTGTSREALNLALAGIRAGTRDGDLYYVAANLAFDLGELSKSEQLVRLLLAFDPEHLNGWVLFGKIYQQKGDLARSNYGLNRAMELFPALAEHNLLGDIMKSNPPKSGQSAGRAGENKEIFETETYADICVKQGYFNKALKIYTQLKERFPENGGIAQKLDELSKKMARHD
jgi:tetratricopeptide (TPR) repeat protein